MRLFWRGFRHHSTARLSPLSGLEWVGWVLLPVWGCERGRDKASQSTPYRRGGPIAVEGLKQRQYSLQPVEGPLRARMKITTQGCLYFDSDANFAWQGYFFFKELPERMLMLNGPIVAACKQFRESKNSGRWPVKVRNGALGREGARPIYWALLDLCLPRCVFRNRRCIW